MGDKFDATAAATPAAVVVAVVAVAGVVVVAGLGFDVAAVVAGVVVVAGLCFDVLMSCMSCLTLLKVFSALRFTKCCQF